MGWERRHFAAAPNRTFITFSNEMIPSPLLADPTGASRGFWQWCDLRAAAGWLAEANRLVAMNPKSFDTRDIVASAATPATYFSQCKHVHEILSAITNMFNALNVPWYTHQASRLLYNSYLSGPIQGSRIFDPNTSTSAHWYVAPGEPYLPLIDDQSIGILPRMARTLYRSKVPSGVRHNLFVQTAGVGLTLAGFPERNDKESLRTSQYTTTQWYYERDVMNQPFIMANNAFHTPGSGGLSPSDFCDGQTNPLAVPFRCDMDLPGDGWIVDTDHTPLTDRNKLLTVFGSTPTAFVDDWRSFRTDLGVTLGDDPHMKVSLGPYHYLQWLKDWVRVLSESTPDEIIISSRETSLWFNLGTLQRNHQAAAALLTSTADQFAQASRADPGLLAAAQASAAIGAAFASITYGISALVGAGAALGLTIAAVTPDPARISVGRDDLGRWKPVLERAWCGGDPSSASVDSQPSFSIPTPPGSASAPPATWTRLGTSARTDAIGNASRSSAQGQLDTISRARTPKPPAQSTVTKLALFGGGAFATFKLLSLLKK